VQIFPGSLVAGLAGVRDLPPFFETSEVARTPVDAGKYL
jgi:LemA protein